MRTFGVLRDRYELLLPTRAGNGHGGSTAAYESAGFAHGAMWASMREQLESSQGARPTVEEQSEFALDTSDVAVTGQMRIRTPDGRDYEILSLATQDGFAFGRARRAA